MARTETWNMETGGNGAVADSAAVSQAVARATATAAADSAATTTGKRR